MPPFPQNYHYFLKIISGCGLGALIHAQMVPLALGQSLIVPDNTLGSEASQVIQNADGQPNELITGGAQRRQNLFHSFEEFNVDQGRGAFFLNPDGINHIFSRITGNNPSNIQGTLGTIGNDANVFLINPNGIVFGPTSRLDVGRSFAAVTSDAIQFGDRGVFSAVVPEEPSDLLTINPTAFLFGNRPSGSIVNTSVIPTGPNTSLSFALGLRVPDGYSLLLLGGDVTSDGSQFSLLGSGVNAFGGRIEIGGLKEAGAIALNVENETTLSLTFPPNITRGNISLINGARIDTVGNGGGKIAIHGHTVDLSEGSGLFTGIGPGLGQTDSQTNSQADGQVNGQAGSQAGSQESSVFIDATDSIRLDGVSSVIESATRGNGNAGHITLQAGNQVSLTGGASISTNSFSLGNAGQVIVRAGNSVLIEGMPFSFLPSRSGIVSSLWPIQDSPAELQEGAIQQPRAIQQLANIRQAGGVLIETNTLTLRDGATIQSNVEVGTAGKGGNITLMVESGLMDGGQIQTLLRGTESGGDAIAQGAAGNITIDATGTVVLDGDTSTGGLISAVGRGAVGNGGTITVEAESLSVRNGATIEARTRGQGNAGNIRLHIDNQAEFDGTTPDGRAASGAYNRVNPSAVGNGGTLKIIAGNLSLSNGAVLNAETSGTGNGGNIILRIAESLEVTGTTTAGQAVSGMSSQVNGGTGNGGNIDIEAGSLSLTDGAVLNASTSGVGNAGNLILRIDGRAALDGTALDGQSVSAIASTVDNGAAGNGNNVELTAESLSITNGARIATETFGTGNAGDIILRITEAAEFHGTSSGGQFASGIFSGVNLNAVGTGGNIMLTAASVDVSNGANLNARTQAKGRAGDITVNTPRLTVESDATITATATETAAPTSRGGSIFLNASTMGRNAAAPGRAGEININVNALVLQDDARITVRSFGDSSAGDIIVNARTIDLGNRARLSAETIAGRDANIDLRVSDRLQLTNRSQIAASSVSGTGGTITIGTERLDVDSNSSIFVNSPNGQAGNVAIAANQIHLDNSAVRATTSENASLDQESANVQVSEVELLTLRNGSLISAEALNQANGGNIAIDADEGFIVVMPDSNSDLIATAIGGDGGRIDITALRLFGLEENSGEFEVLRQNQTNDMSVSSTLGTDGIIAVDDLGLDPVQAIAELPVETAPPPLSQGCKSGEGRGSFTDTGQGGVPLGPGDVRGSDRAWEDISPPVTTEPQTTPPTLTEAHAWTINTQGQVILVAEPEEEATRLSCRP